jgi:S1-C subfamily serine protease
MSGTAKWPRRPGPGCRAVAVAVALTLVVALTGCGNGGETKTVTVGGEGARSAHRQPRVIVETAESGFDATKVYREASPGVVTIRSVLPTGGAEGSGFVLDDKGRIVTNAHVVTDESSGSRKPAKAVYLEFSNRNVVPAHIVGFDPFADVALLEAKDISFPLHPLRLGDDRSLVVGQPVAAIGSPFGEQRSLSVGIVSATDRSVKSLTKFQIDGAIQTDASINPGNSGGPLLDAAARVVGINQQIETSSGSNDGVGFAVPISAVKRSLAQLMRDGKAEYAYIGVSTETLYPQLAEKLGLDTTYGGLISEVVSGGPGEEAGLRGGDERVRFQAGAFQAGGDVILAVDGHKVVQPDDLARIVATYRPGDVVTLEILRDGERKEVDVTLGKRPSA